MEALESAYEDYIERLFSIFVHEIASGQNIDDAAANFKAGVIIANQALAKAKEIISLV